MEQLEKLQNQLNVLNTLIDKFGGRTLENIIQNIEAEIKAIKEAKQ